MTKGIIFDFDGVIADSVDVKTQAFIKIYSKYGKSVVKKVVDHHESNGGISRFEKFYLYHKNFLNKPINKNEILSTVWNYSSDADTHTVETHIYRLRKKIKETFNDDNFIVSTEEGYKLSWEKEI